MSLPSRSPKPIVLLLTTERWTSTARLALAFHSLGCELHLLSPADHPAMVCGVLSRRFRYQPLRPLASLRYALQQSGANVIVPADETVTRQLAELWHRLRTAQTEETNRLRELLTRSLGDPGRLAQVGSRMALQHAAEAEAVATPATMELTDAAIVKLAWEKLGAPLVLKADASSGGRGVRIAATLHEMERIYRGFATAPRWPRAVMRGLIHRDWTHLRRSARREPCAVTAQAMIQGPERNAMVAAHKGNVLAMQVFDVVHTWKLRGPSSVLRRVEDPAVEASIRKLVKRLEITGLCGFDFIVDHRSGEALLLERNARPTQLAHLPLGKGRDLVAAFVRSVVGIDVQDRTAATDCESVALFPQELQRAGQQADLQNSFHDVPWECPALVKRALRGEPKLRRVLLNGRRQSCA